MVVGKKKVVLFLHKWGDSDERRTAFQFPLAKLVLVCPFFFSSNKAPPASQLTSLLACWHLVENKSDRRERERKRDGQKEEEAKGELLLLAGWCTR